jgi:c-di-GMP-binding flagellar brake protein YcgR
MANPSDPRDGDESRRAHQRAILRAPAQLIVPRQPPIDVRTADVSAGGLAIITQFNPPKHATCSVIFTLPDRQHPGRGGLLVRAEAVVAHTTLSSSEGGFRVGLTFLSLTPEALAAIESFVHRFER